MEHNRTEQNRIQWNRIETEHTGMQRNKTVTEQNEIYMEWNHWRNRMGQSTIGVNWSKFSWIQLNGMELNIAEQLLIQLMNYINGTEGHIKIRSHHGVNHRRGTLLLLIVPVRTQCPPHQMASPHPYFMKWPK